MRSDDQAIMSCILLRILRTIARGSLHPRLAKVAITVLGHPACARQMAVVDALRALRIGVSIKAEDDLDHLAPVGAFLGRVEQPEIVAR
jgi:hypothetical protein